MEKHTIIICLDEEIKELSLPSNYDELVQNIQKTFKDQLPKSYVIYFTNKKNDRLHITSSKDYYSALPFIKDGGIFVISKSVNDSSSNGNQSPKLKKSNNHIPKSIIRISSDTNLEKSESEEFYPCYFCDGKKAKNNGLPCKRCKGTGAMEYSLVKRLKNIVKAELGKIIKSMFPKYVKQLVQTQCIFQNSTLFDSAAVKIVHSGISCSTCGMCPIVGIRFECPICSEYNLCESCECNSLHEHPLRVLKESSQNSDKITKNGEQSSDEENKQINYSVMFIEENPKQENIIIETGEQGFKLWTLKNISKLAWPKETILLSEDGCKLIVSRQKIGTLEPETTIRIEVRFQAPKMPGTYSCLCRLDDGNGNRFHGCGCIEVTVTSSNKASVLDHIANQTESDIIIQLKKKFPNISDEYIDNLAQLSQAYKDYDANILLEMLRVKNNSLRIVARELEKLKETH